jgi:hypothetical protein
VQTPRKDNPQKRGRKTLYQPVFTHITESLCRLGATSEQVADALGVTRETIDKWRKSRPEFSDALKKGKNYADAIISDALFQRATGYSYKAVKLFVRAGKVIEHEYTEYYPPDTTAIIFWLKNRRPDLWRDVQRTELTGRDGEALIPKPTMANLTEEELRNLSKLGKEARLECGGSMEVRQSELANPGEVI